MGEDKHSGDFRVNSARSVDQYCWSSYCFLPHQWCDKRQWGRAALLRSMCQDISPGLQLHPLFTLTHEEDNGCLSIGSQILIHFPTGARWANNLLKGHCLGVLFFFFPLNSRLMWDKDPGSVYLLYRSIHFLQWPISISLQKLSNSYWWIEDIWLFDCPKINSIFITVLYLQKTIII